MADTADSKSAIRRYVRVQVPPRAPFQIFILKSKIKISVALPEATPSPFALSSLRYAPLRPANALRAAQQKYLKMI